MICNHSMYIVRILVFWYNVQKRYIRWNNTTSDSFSVSNGVRQGGILSPYLFCVYMDDLSKKLNNVNAGCFMGTALINNLLYADDLVISDLGPRLYLKKNTNSTQNKSETHHAKQYEVTSFLSTDCELSTETCSKNVYSLGPLAPSHVGLSMLLSVCSDYGLEHDIKFNSAKSNIMIFCCKKFKYIHVPSFELNDNIYILPRVNQCKYLGHVITDDLKDDNDIARQYKRIYAQGNALIRKYYIYVFRSCKVYSI